MKAIVYEQYGGPEVLNIREVPKPAPAEDEILIKVHAVSLNGSDREGLIGKPAYARMGGLRAPRHGILGSDIAGVVEAVGKHHQEFRPGDAVFGELPGYRGGLAEYACTHGKTLMRKPPMLTDAQAAAIPQGGVIAYRGICTKGAARPGQKVLINGAGGSAGSFAIQLAKLQGADVTGVDNAAKQDFMRSLGADAVINSELEDFTAGDKRYDLILDLIAYGSVRAYARALNRNGTYFFAGGSTNVIFQTLFYGPVIRMAQQKKLRMLVVPQNRSDLIAITELCVTGKIFPAIDREYEFADVREAFGRIAEGEALGKVVIIVART